MTDYGDHSSAQQSIISTHDADLRDLAARLASDRTDLRAMDYGCGPGPSAMSSVRPVLEVFRAKRPDGRLAVCHMDQPGNDWNTLFQRAHGPDGYHATVRDVRTEAAVGSFYDRMAENGSVDLATCFAASHWSSRGIRLNCPGTVWFADLEGAARAEMADLARSDWVRFLSMRAEELSPGGYLFVSTLGSVPDPDERNGAAASGRGIYRALQVVAQSMVDDGLLKPKVLDEFLFSLWFLTADEAAEPLTTEAALSAAYRIDRIDVLPSPIHPTDFFGDLLGDPAAYGEAYKGYIRAFADSTLRTQLIGPSASEGHTEDALAGEFYRRLSDLYRARPGEFAFELWHLTVVLQRT